MSMLYLWLNSTKFLLTRYHLVNMTQILRMEISQRMRSHFEQTSVKSITNFSNLQNTLSANLIKKREHTLETRIIY